MGNDAVRDSRAGDVFHYRWAARRCLRMVNPNSKITSIVIEGSKEPDLAGEYVMDVTEYFEATDGRHEEITYYQLKHSSKRVDQPFELSELKNTITGFADRYREHLKHPTDSLGTITFSIITNRPLSDAFKDGILAIATCNKPKTKFLNTLKNYTQLADEALQHFCAAFKWADDEGNFADQKRELHFEMAAFFAGIVEHDEINNVIELVQKQVLPNANGKIVPENVLMCLGVTSKEHLFPAPPKFEPLNNSIQREQHAELLAHIVSASEPIIIHAGGGVGKSVACRLLADDLPIGSVGIVYDCFGGGEYLNVIKKRHRYRDALIQIANELAVLDLCERLILRSKDSEDDLLRAFLNRLDTAGKKLRQANPNSILAIFIDAADNAEMAAEEFNHEPCFASQLLRQKLPMGCKIIALSRSESKRIALLKPLSNVIRLELKPFSQTETLNHLRKYFPNASSDDGLEFHRLTSGNPRVQANAINFSPSSLSKVLAGLGPGRTVEEQIATQLKDAIAKLKDHHPLVFKQQIDAICLGLANLHPFIPIEVLAVAADVDSEAVKSFVADLGRPLLLSDHSVQFRDEPTETWFRQQFSASPAQIDIYINRLKPLATGFNYVAEVLPILLLRSENYAELIRLALSDELLPESPIDKRNVRVYRLQFAFKAALRKQLYADAAKLALRAGEEMAGDQRQLELLSKNTDLIATLQSPQRVQELAFRRMLGGAWRGSENIYSATLLSSVEDFKGEARGYLRSAHNWLNNYFDEREKDKFHRHEERLQDEHIVELAFAHLNLSGAQKCVDYIASWRPPSVGFRVTKLLVSRLIDTGQFATINEIAELGCRNVYLMLAIADELIAFGKFPPIKALQNSLVLLGHSRTRIKKSKYNWRENSLRFAIVSFAEACAASGLCFSNIQRILKHYLPTTATYPIYSDHADSEERSLFVRSTALKALLSGNLQPDFKLLMPEKWLDKQPEYEREQDIKRFEQVVGSLLPWFLLRAQFLLGGVDDADALTLSASQQSKRACAQRYQSHDRLPFELTLARFECLVFNPAVTEAALNDFVTELSGKEFRFSTADRLNALRTACRLAHLTNLRKPLERSCRDMITSDKDEGPESLADSFIRLARAVLPVNPEDAKAYFDEAIEVVSKFGDELVDRWQAIVAAATRFADGGYVIPETAYRFIRCAELVGNTVAEEKYWDRDEAIETCFKLHPTSAFAALSRWRDREIGWLGGQLSALVQAAIKSKQLTSAVGWSLAVFSQNYGLDSFAALCIELEMDNSRRQVILDHAVRDLRLRNSSETSWRTLASTAQRFSLTNKNLDQVLAFYADQVNLPAQAEQYVPSTISRRLDEAPTDWQTLFAGLDLTSSKGLSQAIDRFDAITGPRSPETFWQELFSRVPENKASQILDSLINAESADAFDVEYGLNAFPSAWRENISVQRAWPKVFQSIGRRFPSRYTTYYSRIYCLKSFQATEQEIECLNQGILEGLANSYNQVDAGTLFGFSHVASALITPEQAADVLDFGLKRFEEHIDDQYADGLWADWLTPTELITEAVSGFIWSALGSPRSAERWQAAHCVRRLAETGCTEEIDALISWIAKDNVGAFGSHKYPFYNLHARQYLLIAIARAAMDGPQIFLKHHAIFAHYALNDIPHALIQKYAADIALLLEAAFPYTYEPDVIVQLRQVGLSPFPVRTIEDYRNHFDSPWHERGEVDKSLEFYFSYDFDRYWFEPLGHVFCIKSQQVEELARETVFKYWDIAMEGVHVRDPRQDLWRSDRDSWHSRSDYPKIDNYQFYISYHAMLMVAATLVQTMPVVQRNEWYENEWVEWLQRHLLTRSDNRWLADRRDPAPLLRRAWLKNDKSDSWRWEIVADDFLEGLLLERDGKTWLNVSGSWSDNDSDRIEQFYVASAFVHPEASTALLNALKTCSNPRDFKIPDYQEEGMEFDEPPFQLQGWIYSKSQDKGLDEYDPFAGDISYPPYQPGESIVEQLGLTTDCEQRNWYLPTTDNPVLISELWGDRPPNGRDSPVRHGNRISASLDFLANACSRLGRDLIIEVQIERRYAYNSYRAKTDDEIQYPPPYSKVYLLSADGKLRDAGKSYQLRESIS
jgi:hypothetical protein